MAAAEAQPVWRHHFSSASKQQDCRLRMGPIGAPMPDAYKGNGLLVTVRQTGWPQLDNKTVNVVSWADGDAGTAPLLRLRVSTANAQGDDIPRPADAFVEIRQIPANAYRYPLPT